MIRPSDPFDGSALPGEFRSVAGSVPPDPLAISLAKGPLDYRDTRGGTKIAENGGGERLWTSMTRGGLRPLRRQYSSSRPAGTVWTIRSIRSCISVSYSPSSATQ